jgi:hypothetical protein
MKKAIFALVVLALLGGNALADVPDPAFCEVDPWDSIQRARGIPCDPPHPGADVTVTVRANVGGIGSIIDTAYVIIEFSHMCDDSICVCDNATLEGQSPEDGLGTVVLNAGVGGCCRYPGAVTVWAGDDDTGSFVAIRSYDIYVSPDRNADCQVSLSDFSWFAGQYGFLVPPAETCADFNGDDQVSLADFSYFASSYGCVCTEAP